MTLPVTIDSLKSTISRRGGLARNNRFAIYMSHPGGKSSLLNTDFSSLLGNAARSVISGGLNASSVTSAAKASLGGLFNDPRDMYLLCDSVNLPGRQIATFEPPEGSMKPVKVPYSFINEDVNFTYNVTNDYYSVKFWKSWMDLIIPQTKDQKNYKLNFKEKYTTDIIIQQMGNTDYIPVYSVKLNDAYPITFNSIELSNQSDNSVVQIQVTVTYDNWYELSALETLGEIGSTAIDIGKSTIASIGKLF